MSEINYKELDTCLPGLKKKGMPAIFLIYGEEVLYKSAYDSVLKVLLPESSTDLNVESFDGANSNIPDVIEKVSTYSLLSGQKIIVVNDSQIFQSSKDEGKILEKARQAFDDDDVRKASRYFLNLLGMLNIAFEDIVSAEGRKKVLKPDPVQAGDTKWIDKIITYCRDHDLSIPPASDYAGSLQRTIERGIPSGNYLVITTENIDKRRTLFKAIKSAGLIIDCSVPTGDRKADRAEQEAVLNEKMKSVLAKHGKSMDRAAYESLFEMTGFNLRTFLTNIEKLIDFTGDREKITTEDVSSALSRTRQDPIYELTNAVASRNAGQALFYLASLADDGIHPLQALAAVINQVRKLVLARSFIDSEYGRAWRTGMSYNEFVRTVISAIQDYDTALLTCLKSRDASLSEPDNIKEKSQKGKKKKSAVTSDLIIAKNPKNAYPIYQLISKADGFSDYELKSAVNFLAETDFRIKTSGQDSKHLTEAVIIRICNKN
ncbi:MAG: hypothetical protein K9L30_02710 [Desulfobacterales bacterium]|nr:hypothetical protein [Desulfobacterales bacterium]